jgi:hypothetical protein
MFRTLTALLMVLFFLSCLFIACEEEKEKIVEVVVHDTVRVDVEVEVVPVVVDGIIADPDSIGVAGHITLTADITKESNVGELTYKWFATGGQFDSEEGDTVMWMAPEEAGTYVISVHATDGVYIGIGKRNVGVGMYAATSDTFYVGASSCSQCHSDVHDNWAMTGHAGAWASLQTSDHAASYCNPCHTVDFAEVPGNAGYDDAPIEKYRNVQCENCHGPGSGHPGSESAIMTDISSDNCITCHSGDHHPFSRDWLAAGHNFNTTDAAHGAAERSYCQPCHSGSGFISTYDTDYDTRYGFNAEDPGNVSCAACHDPHSSENEHLIRTLAEVPSTEANGESQILAVAGNGQLCVQCHHARRGPDQQILEGYEHFGPHGSPQGDMLAGVTGYEGLNNFEFTGKFTNHYVIEDGCVSCHMNSIPYSGADPEATDTGHSFEATTEACAVCHGEISDFTEIMASSDFDDDGSVEGLQLEVMGLMHGLEDALVAAGLDTTGHGDFESALSATMEDTLADGSQKPENIRLRAGGYNLVFAEADGSHGVHNPEYTVQLLHQSIAFLQEEKLQTASLLRAHDKAILGF